MFASIVAEEKRQHPDLFLEAAIPYAGRLKTRIPKCVFLSIAFPILKFEIQKPLFS